MNTKNTASQPKVASIGGDETFLSLLNECTGAASDGYACGGDFGTAEKVHAAEEKLIAYLDSKLRAPADQAASVAPDTALLDEVQAVIGEVNYLDYRWLQDASKFGVRVAIEKALNAHRAIAKPVAAEGQVSAAAPAGIGTDARFFTWFANSPININWRDAEQIWKNAIESTEEIPHLHVNRENAIWNIALDLAAKNVENFCSGDSEYLPLADQIRENKIETAAAQASDETNINGPMTDAQRQHARHLYQNLHHLGPDAMEDVVRYASVCGYTNGHKDFMEPCASEGQAQTSAAGDDFARGVIAALGVLTAFGYPHGSPFHDEIVHSVGEASIYAAAEDEDYEWAGLNPSKKPIAAQSADKPKEGV